MHRSHTLNALLLAALLLTCSCATAPPRPMPALTVCQPYVDGAICTPPPPAQEYLMLPEQLIGLVCLPFADYAKLKKEIRECR